MYIHKDLRETGLTATPLTSTANESKVAWSVVELEGCRPQIGSDPAWWPPSSEPSSHRAVILKFWVSGQHQGVEQGCRESFPLSAHPRGRKSVPSRDFYLQGVGIHLARCQDLTHLGKKPHSQVGQRPLQVYAPEQYSLRVATPEPVCPGCVRFQISKPPASPACSWQKRPMSSHPPPLPAQGDHEEIRECRGEGQGEVLTGSGQLLSGN